MSQYILAALCFVCYIIIDYVIGAAVTKLLKFENKPTYQLIYGLFVYQIMFFIYVMPLKLHVVKADTIGKIWFSLIAVLMVVIIIWLRSYMAEGLKEWFRYMRERRLSSLFVVVMTLAETTFVEIYGRYLGGSNQVWFVGWVSNAVAHNELMTYDTASGLAAKKFENNRYLCTFLDHSGVVCRLTGLNAQVEVRTVLVAVFTIVECIVIWELAKYFGKDRSDRTILGYLIYWTARNMMVRSQVLPGFYSYFRAFEGKGFVANVTVPLLLLLMWKVYDDPEDFTLTIKSAIVLFGSMMYSLAILFSFPFMLVAYTPFLLARKNKKMLRYVIVLGVICTAVYAVFYLGRKGFIDLTIHR